MRLSASQALVYPDGCLGSWHTGSHLSLSSCWFLPVCSFSPRSPRRPNISHLSLIVSSPFYWEFNYPSPHLLCQIASFWSSSGLVCELFGPSFSDILTVWLCLLFFFFACEQIWNTFDLLILFCSFSGIIRIPNKNRVDLSCDVKKTDGVMMNMTCFKCFCYGNELDLTKKKTFVLFAYTAKPLFWVEIE